MKKKVSTTGPVTVLVVGSVTIDRIIENRKTSERLGGVATYGGLTFRRLGVETAVVTNIAESDRGLLDVLDAEGLAVHAGTSRLTTQVRQPTPRATGASSSCPRRQIPSRRPR